MSKVLSNRVSLSSIAKSFVGILAVWLSHFCWYLSSMAKSFLLSVVNSTRIVLGRVAVV